ncbi:MAG: DUF1398 family protein [Myxococcales bacterium]|nr:DUF1398 family protein [Myxococcales bacterium]USN51619.1 MAG: DUF1398 family protein [Myxococcales bacterium]
MFQSIKELCDKMMNQEFSFADFSRALKDMNVERVSVDFIRKEHVFYFQDGRFFIYSLPSDYELVIAKTFDQQKVKDAIFEFDRNIINPRQFHMKLSAAGVLIATGFFMDQRGIYVGQNCNFYLEEWDDEFC